MSQHDLDIANQGFPATRSDLNLALKALGSSNSGASAPSTTYANQLWYDTGNNILKIRNEDNDAWISLLTLDQSADAVTQIDVDNIRIDGNTISSTDTNGDITLDPNGTGDTVMTGSGGQVTVDESGHITTKQSLDAVTAGGRLIGASNRGTVGQIGIEQSATGADGGHIHLSTCASGSTSPTERMRINSDGRVNIGGTADVVISGTEELTVEGAVGIKNTNNVGLGINRDGGDGNLIGFQESGVLEGTISVSGTTVSYNGGHLSRWSQATDGNRIDGLVKGTVMTNLDQMVVWHHEAQAATYYEEGDALPVVTEATFYTDDDVLPDGVSVGDEKTAAVYASIGDEKTPAVDAYDEDNEQLNCMAVSSVEGDANVAGVFVNWDDDDEDYTADMNIAMTGDMVIRIAQGTTVARGDLLMSAGDGTAKPQDDDIVRSKTIAKVTSTTVSHTYDDGTYLVPCVLMAC